VPAVWRSLLTENSNAVRMDSRLRNERRLAIGHVVRVGILIVRKLAWRHPIAFDDQALPSKFDARQQRRLVAMGLADIFCARFRFRS
jgi:hypothetical protein